MADKNKPKAQMAAAMQPTTANRTGTWRFEKPVLVEQIAPCRAACPVGEDIPGIMALNDAGAFEDAYRRILLENPFPGICGKLCFHPCEKACNRRRFDQAVSIRDLEYFVSNYDYCPDLSIHMDPKQKYREIDYDHCKGCGICAAECPRAAIDWVKD